MINLTVFDPARVPTDDIAEFLHWFDLTTEWGEERDYTSTTGTFHVLVPWYDTMVAEFPPVTDGLKGTTRYIIGSTCICARFGDAVAEAAETRARELAAGKLGLYVSGSGEVTLADGSLLQ